MRPETQPNIPVARSNAGAAIMLAPIVPEKAEAWRRVMQELAGSRRREYEESRRRLGIRAERAWMSETRQRAIGLIVIEADDVQQALAGLASSDHPFDRWFREQLLVLQGIDLNHPHAAFLPDLVFAWQRSERS